MEDHLARLKIFYEVISNHGLTLSIKESILSMPKIEFLGATIYNGTMETQPCLHKVQAYPDELINLKQVQSFRSAH